MNDRTTTETQAPILVTGGTGTLGRLVVARLRDAGRGVRVLSRGKLESGETTPDDGVGRVIADLATGDGLDTALAGADIVVHLAGSAKGDDVKARHVVDAAKRFGTRHLVYISVVGANRIPMAGRMDRAMFGYFGAKAAAERIVAESGVPWTTLRATQFHDFVLKTVSPMARMPLAFVPGGWRFQPVDARDVADRLVELTLGAPSGLVPDLGGPRIYALTDLVRSYLEAIGKRRPIVPIRIPGAASRAFREGANLSPERAVGRRTWEAFLAEQVRVSRTTEPAPVA